MKWVILLVGVVVICFVAALILGLVGGSGMGRATSSLHHEPLPDDAAPRRRLRRTSSST